jgi:hypothetical protein
MANCASGAGDVRLESEVEAVFFGIHDSVQRDYPADVARLELRSHSYGSWRADLIHQRFPLASNLLGQASGELSAATHAPGATGIRALAASPIWRGRRDSRVVSGDVVDLGPPLDQELLLVDVVEGEDHREAILLQADETFSTHLQSGRAIPGAFDDFRQLAPELAQARPVHDTRLAGGDGRGSRDLGGRRPQGARDLPPRAFPADPFQVLSPTARVAETSSRSRRVFRCFAHSS